MQKKDGTRDGRATRVPAEPEVEQVITLLDGPATRGQRNFITHTLRELSDATGVRLPKPGADLRDFYLEAAYACGAAGPRWRMREILKLIAGGERFDDYKKGNPFYIWRDKRKCRNHSCTKSIAAELERRLSDPKTPADYRAAIRRALRALCKVSGTRYDAKDPAGSYVDAEAEAEGFGITSDGWNAHRDARSNLIQLLEGLRKRRPLSSVESRATRGEEHARQLARASTTQAPATAADFNDPWDELRDEFEQFLDEIEPDGEAGEE